MAAVGCHQQTDLDKGAQDVVSAGVTDQYFSKDSPAHHPTILSGAQRFAACDDLTET